MSPIKPVQKHFFASLADGRQILEALGRNGGGINALARHSVAALLNATNGTVDYPDEDTASIIADFQAAVAGGASRIEAQKNTFDGGNNGAGGCPLN